MVSKAVIAVIIVAVVAGLYFWFSGGFPVPDAGTQSFASAFADLEKVRLNSTFSFSADITELSALPSSKFNAVKSSLSSFKSKINSISLSKEDSQALNALTDIHLAYVDLLLAKKTAHLANQALTAEVIQAPCDSLSLFETAHTTLADYHAKAIAVNDSIAEFKFQFPQQALTSNIENYISDPSVLNTALTQSQKGLTDLQRLC